MEKEEKQLTIAIVGNSPILLEKEYGEEIDGHDEVLRFNYFKTVGFEKSVGSKTTMYAFANICKDLNPIFKTLDKDKLFFRFDLDKNDERFINTLKDISKGALSVNDVTCIDKSFLEKVTKKVTTKQICWPNSCYVSTGLAMLEYIYLNYPDAQIDAYGFSFFDPKVKFHYFDDIKGNLKCHEGDKEKFYFNNVLSKKINLHL